MENNTGLLEEFDILREVQTPHLIHKDFSLANKQKVAYSVLSRKPEEILLINSSGFYTDAVFAGLSGKHIEYIAKNAPSDYRQEIMNLLSQDYKHKEIMEIAQAMDEDLDDGSTKNQERVKNVIQYIKDNAEIFKF